MPLKRSDLIIWSAVTCVLRQSSAHQLLHNRESSALQYAMRDG